MVTFVTGYSVIQDPAALEFKQMKISIKQIPRPCNGQFNIAKFLASNIKGASNQTR